MTIRSFAAILALAFFAPMAAAESRVLDVTTGALFDGILDGFPGIAALDGEPDLAGNQLGTALKLRVTEERGIAEFALASLADISPDAIREVRLTFNIDDVLSTFGPGTDFSGRAARTLLIHVYEGDGQIALNDFKNVAGDAFVVDTTIFGDITDSTLRSSGPNVIDVDITSAVKVVIAHGATHIGVVWRTTDAGTGTSLDDLGDGSVGPPGVGGARLPFLTFDLADPPTPSPTVPLPSATPTATATMTPLKVCGGDCDGSSDVTVDELVRMISIAVGLESGDACVAGDTDESGTITVDEIVKAVVTALDGCVTR